MRNPGGENKISVGLHIVALIAHLIPSSAFHTIYENKLVYRILAFAEMKCGSGIVAYVGDVEGGRYGVLFHLPYIFLRKHKCSFSSETVFEFYHG